MTQPLLAPRLAESQKSSAGRWPLVFSLLALGFSISAFANSLRPEPPPTAEPAFDPLAEFGKPLGDYDRSTPWNALRSEPLILCDLRAAFAYLREMEGEKTEEKLRTLELHREEDFQDYKLLFVTYQEGERTRHEVRAYQQKESTGHWFDHTDMFHRARNFASSDEEKAIVKASKDWEQKDQPNWRFQFQRVQDALK